jgi:hypothetical protein
MAQSHEGEVTAALDAANDLGLIGAESQIIE